MTLETDGMIVNVTIIGTSTLGTEDVQNPTEMTQGKDKGPTPGTGSLTTGIGNLLTVSLAIILTVSLETTVNRPISKMLVKILKIKTILPLLKTVTPTVCPRLT